MTKKLKWGILSTAKIAREKMIPALQKSSLCEVFAIASRTVEKAKETAETLHIQKYYDSYEALLNDKEIDVVYIPLPNHMHVEWAIKSLQSGKHVLCEKPIGINQDDALKLWQEAKKHPRLKLMEAFMYRFHPQWEKVKELVDSAVIGEVKSLQTYFSYYNIDPNNIRNKPEVYGGALMDIGCYCISFPRYILGVEPQRVMGIMDFDPEMKTDRLTSGILEFSSGVISTFTCSTQLMPYQRVQILGTEGRIEIEIPVNAPIDLPTHIWLTTKSDRKELIINPVDQYTLQGDYFAASILNESHTEPSLEDSVNNMKVMDAIVLSSKENKWVRP